MPPPLELRSICLLVGSNDQVMEGRKQEVEGAHWIPIVDGK
jgi:hypothetical protein